MWEQGRNPTRRHGALRPINRKRPSTVQRRKLRAPCEILIVVGGPHEGSPHPPDGPSAPPPRGQAEDLAHHPMAQKKAHMDWLTNWSVQPLRGPLSRPAYSDPARVSSRKTRITVATIRRRSQGHLSGAVPSATGAEDPKPCILNPKP
jgi:hypothetical protein